MKEMADFPIEENLYSALSELRKREKRRRRLKNALMITFAVILANASLIGLGFYLKKRYFTAPPARKTLGINTDSSSIIHDNIRETGSLHKGPFKEPCKEPFRTPCMEPCKEPCKEPFKGPCKEQSNEPFKGPCKEQCKEPFRTPNIEQRKEPFKAPNIEQRKEPFKAPNIEQSKEPFKAPNIEQSKQPFKAPNIEQSKQPFKAPDIEQYKLPFKAPNIEQCKIPYNEPPISPKFPEHSSGRSSPTFKYDEEDIQTSSGRKKFSITPIDTKGGIVGGGDNNIPIGAIKK